MRKFKVSGMAQIEVSTIVEIEEEGFDFDDEDAIISLAIDQCALNNYCGNGGSDKLVGVDGEDDSIECFDEIDFNEVEEE